MHRDISIIVPITPGESAWPGVFDDLARCGSPRLDELIFVGPKPPLFDPGRVVKADIARLRVAWTRSPAGRARQMNRGAKSARGRYLWFVHADSRVSKNGVESLTDALLEYPGAVQYFDLGFQPDGPKIKTFNIMKVNQVGAWIRSHLFQLPFGDQGLCVPRPVFELLGGFDETIKYGEDHALVWAAHHRQIPIRCTGATLTTSARKYRDQGWIRTTLRHQFLTVRQAIPELAGILRRKARVLDPR